MKIRNLKKTRFGRFVCQVLGNEKGAVAMEYVVLAVLIAAAIVVAVAVFGKTIVTWMPSSTAVVSYTSI